MIQPEKQQPAVATQSFIRKLTTEKAVKAHRQLASDKDASEDDITNIKLAARGIKSIESLDLPSLRRLDLSKNNLNRLKGLQGCPQVTYLTAAGNELTGEGLDGVRPLKDLKVLNASGNHVRRIPPAVFAQFRQLQALVLNNNEIAEVPPTWFKKGLLSLNTLVLSHNKVKSLSDSGLERLTALTKLSVSFNTLVELPDLSVCSGLEELRAAHNLISQVPASLGKNAALRTLDLGHNRIDKWVGLERLGKSLKSLMQLSLAGNPVCGPPATVTASEKEKEKAEEEGEGEGEGEYVVKVRSLFPSLKVRDGKRILMKKSHTYYETRRGEEGDGGGGGSGAEDAQGPGGNRRKPGQAVVGRGEGGAGADGRRVLVGGKGANKDAKNKSGETSVGRGGRGSEGSFVNTSAVGEGGEEGTSKAKRKLKKKAARAAAAAAGAEAKTEAATPESTGKKSKKRRRREAEEEAEEERRSQSPILTAGAASISSQSTGDSAARKKKQLRQSSEKAAAASTATGTGDPSTAQAASKLEASTKKKKKRKKTKQEESKKSSGGGGGGGGGGVQQQDVPYSSSEELPIPGRQSKKSATAVAAGAAAAAASVGGDRESGVVAVIINKKRGGKGATARPRQGGAPRAGGRPEGAREFSVDAMLEARGQKETIGLGSGVSAW